MIVWKNKCRDGVLFHFEFICFIFICALAKNFEHSFYGENMFILSIKIWIWVKLPYWSSGAHKVTTLAERNVWWQRTQFGLSNYDNNVVVSICLIRIAACIRCRLALFAAINKISFHIQFVCLIFNFVFRRFNVRWPSFSPRWFTHWCVRFVVTVRIRASGYFAFTLAFVFRT